MSPIITTVVWLATTLAVHGFALLALWLRLRWRARQEQVHQPVRGRDRPGAARRQPDRRGPPGRHVAEAGHCPCPAQ